MGVTLRRLRPRSAPTKSATIADAGLPRTSAGVSYWARIAADVEDRDAVAHLHGLLDVVGHEHDRLAHLVLQAQELVLEPHAGDGVDRAERLVHQQDRRVGGERRGPRRPAGAARRRAGRGSGRGTRRGRGRPARGARRRGPSTRFLSQPEQPGHGRRRSSAIVWCGNRPTCWITYPIRRRSSTGSTCGDVLVVEEDAAAGRLDEPVDHLQGGRLAAARRPDEHADLALGDLEAELAHGDGAVRVPLGDGLEADHDAPSGLGMPETLVAGWRGRCHAGASSTAVRVRVPGGTGRGT